MLLLLIFGPLSSFLHFLQRCLHYAVRFLFLFEVPRAAYTYMDMFGASWVITSPNLQKFKSADWGRTMLPQTGKNLTAARTKIRQHGTMETKHLRSGLTWLEKHYCCLSSHVLSNAAHFHQSYKQLGHAQMQSIFSWTGKQTPLRLSANRQCLSLRPHNKILETGQHIRKTMRELLHSHLDVAFPSNLVPHHQTRFRRRAVNLSCVHSTNHVLPTSIVFRCV